jgi:hypothetical protein
MNINRTRITITTNFDKKVSSLSPVIYTQVNSCKFCDLKEIRKTDCLYVTNKLLFLQPSIYMKAGLVGLDMQHMICESENGFEVCLLIDHKKHYQITTKFR